MKDSIEKSYQEKLNQLKTELDEAQNNLVQYELEVEQLKDQLSQYSKRDQHRLTLQEEAIREALQMHKVDVDDIVRRRSEELIGESRRAKEESLFQLEQASKEFQVTKYYNVSKQLIN